MHHSGGDVDNEEGYACIGRGYMGNLWHFLQFCCEPKTALKNKVYFLNSIKLKISKDLFSHALYKTEKTPTAQIKNYYYYHYHW